MLFPAPAAAGRLWGWDSPSLPAPGCQPTREGVLGWFWQHPPTCSPCSHGSFCSSSNTSQLFPGEGWRVAAQPCVCSPLIYHLAQLQLNSDPFGISEGDFHGKREHLLGMCSVCYCLEHPKFRWGTPTSPLQELRLLSSSLQ